VRDYLIAELCDLGLQLNVLAAMPVPGNDLQMRNAQPEGQPAVQRKLAASVAPMRVPHLLATARRTGGALP
jgi:hypothetical protein